MTRVLLIAEKLDTRARFRKLLEEIGVPHEEVDSISAMRKKMQKTPFNGVILDVLTAVRASPSEKALIQEISDLFPTLRLRWDSREQCLRGLFIGESLDRENPVADFLDRFCRSSPARVFRQHNRMPLHFNVLLSRNRSFRTEQTEKTVTLDICEGGCFLFSTRDWEHGDLAWVRFLEFSEPTPFQVEIRRFNPWGKEKQLPGIGVKFQNLQPAQLLELSRQLDQHKRAGGNNDQQPLTSPAPVSPALAEKPRSSRL